LLAKIGWSWRNAKARIACTQIELNSGLSI